jgi:hypothetical protein
VNIDSVHVTLRSFDSLPGKFYTVWIGDSTGSSFKRGTGTARLFRTDTTFNEDGAPIPDTTIVQLGNVSAFTFGSPREVIQLSITRTTAGLLPSDSIKIVLVTIEADANATTPNLASTAFWARRGEGSPATNPDTSVIALRNNNLRMGEFVPGPQTILANVFIPTIRGRGFFQGPLLFANDSSLARPPKGYYYAFWALKAPLGTESGDTLFLGDQRSPWPRRDISHRDADISIPDPLVVLATPPSILAGSIRVSADTLGLPSDFPWKGFTEVWVTLQAKDGVPGRMGVMRIATGFVPGVINLGQRQ